MKKDLTWKNTFHDFNKAHSFFTESVRLDVLSELEAEGLIHCFEFTFELALKAIKEYLEGKSINVKYPGDVIEEAFKYQIIKDEGIWLDMFEKRKIMIQTYEEEIATTAINLIKNGYAKALNQAHEYLKAEME
jgi:nucleotidyltransferase substrate binding protein (TIGR01987 family)